MMISILLAGTSAAAITASLADVPLTWSDLTTTSFNNTASINTGRTYLSVFTPKVLPFTHTRITVSSVAGGGYTISKMYVGEVTATREGYVFQSAPTPVTFDGGSTSLVLPAASSKMSDEIALSFTGKSALGVAYILSAQTGNNQRLLFSTGNWITFYASGDILPDPVNTNFGWDSATSVWLIADVDVAYGHFVSTNTILADRQNVHVVKEGYSPSDANKIKATQHTFYVVKS